MRLPKGASYKLIPTKATSLDAMLERLSSEEFTGYVRMTVEKDGDLEEGYMLLVNGEVVGAQYEGAEQSNSKKAFEEIKKAWALEGIADLYKFTEFQIHISLEENPDTLFQPVIELKNIEVVKRPNIEKKTEKVKTPSEKAPEPVDVEVSEDRERSIAEDILTKRKERVELLKKFNLKEPDDEFLESILKGFSLPSNRELNSKSRELKKEILSRLKKSIKAEELDLYINPAKLKDTVEFDVDVYVKPLNKDIENTVKSAVDAAFKEKLTFPYEKGLKINIAE